MKEELIKKNNRKVKKFNEAAENIKRFLQQEEETIFLSEEEAHYLELLNYVRTTYENSYDEDGTIEKTMVAYGLSRNEAIFALRDAKKVYSRPSHADKQFFRNNVLKKINSLYKMALEAGNLASIAKAIQLEKDAIKMFFPDNDVVLPEDITPPVFIINPDPQLLGIDEMKRQDLDSFVAKIIREKAEENGMEYVNYETIEEKNNEPEENN